MRRVKKMFLTIACAGALVVGSVAATMAYLTSEDSAVNTFTVGDVQIKLDEAAVNDAGQRLNSEGDVWSEGEELADRVKGNAYHLLPGLEYYKDPTVTVLEGSEESYVRMLVKVSNIAALENAFGDSYMNNDVFLLEKIVGGWDDGKWVFHGYSEPESTASGAVSGLYEFRYYQTVDGIDAHGNKAGEVLPALFTSISIPGDEIDNDELAQLEGVTVTVTAHAIQAAGFANDVAAWSAWS